MSKEDAVKRLNHLISMYLRVPEGEQQADDVIVSDLAADWRIIDLGIAVETELGIPMSADKALSLKSVGDWRNLVRDSSDD